MKNIDPYLVSSAIEPILFVGSESLSFRLHGSFSSHPRREEHLAFELVNIHGETVPTQPPIYLDRVQSVALLHDMIKRLTYAG
jgi:hypothetical protein